MVQVYLRFADYMLALSKFLTIVIVGGMLVCVLVGVFFRFVIPLPVAWPPEAARFLMVAVTMIGSSVAIRQLDHVGITFLVDALSKRLALALYIVGNVLILIFLAVFIFYSTKLTLDMGPRQISSSLGMSMVIPYLSMPLGGLMMFVQQVAALLQGVLRFRQGSSPFYSTLSQSSV